MDATTGRLYIRESLRATFYCLLFLLTLVLLPGLVWAEDTVTQSCPLRTHRYAAQLITPHVTTTVGETAMLRFLLEPSKPPQGFFLSVNMNALQEPYDAKGKKPDILTGFPETSILFHAPGVYRYGVVVSLIAKSSCGGVKADTILKGEVFIDVKP